MPITKLQRIFCCVISALTIVLVALPVTLSLPLSHLGQAFDEKHLLPLAWSLPIMLLLHIVLARCLEIFWCILFDIEYAAAPLSRGVRTFLYGAIFRRSTHSPFAVTPKRIAAGIVLIAISAALLSFFGASSIDAVLQIATHRDLIAPAQITTWSSFLQVVFPLAIISPMIETVIMVAILEILVRSRKISERAIIIMSAAGWAILHGINNHPMQALSMFWLFFIFTTLYFRARQLSGWGLATIAVLFAHCLNNILALCLIAVKQLSFGF
jgi:hypothetical protein